MADRVDQLFQEWHHLGGAVLLAEVDASLTPRQPEEVLAESTAHCRESGRLTWVVLDWLIQHIDEIDETLLLKHTRASGDLSVLGVLADAAYQRRPHVKFERIMRDCTPHAEVEPFFIRIAQSALATQIAHENSVDIFRRWNYLSSELRYLADG